jgi:hypothetical protein
LIVLIELALTRPLLSWVDANRVGLGIRVVPGGEVKAIDRQLAGKVVNQAKRVFDVASPKFRLVLHDLAPVLHESLPEGLYIIYGYFQDRSQWRPGFYKQVDVLAMKANHFGIVIRNLESKLLNVKAGGLLWILRLNQNVSAKFIRHTDSPWQYFRSLEWNRDVTPTEERSLRLRTTISQYDGIGPHPRAIVARFDVRTYVDIIA